MVTVVVSAQAQGIVKVYRGHLERYRGYQRVHGSNWTDADVIRELAPDRQRAEADLYRLGYDRRQVTELLNAADRPPPTPAADSTSFINTLIRNQRADQQPSKAESMNDWIRRQSGR